MTFWTAFLSPKKQTAARPPALEHLRLQVLRAKSVSMRALDRSTFAARPLTDGLVEVLVEDHAAHERVLRWDVVRAFNKPDHELFAIARAQAATATCDVTTMELGGGVQVLASNGFYLSALLLDRFARSKHPHGVLFAPISWHHWCIHVVQAMTVPPTVALMAIVVDDVRRQMRVADYEALTGDVYWSKPGGSIEKLELVGEGAERRAVSPEFAKAIA
jgi:hypothetical protein